MFTQESSYTYILIAALAVAVALTFAALVHALHGLQVFS
jgi:hypothetical protein